MSNNNGKDRSTIIQSGIIILIIVSIGFSGYMINQALEIAQKTKERSDTIEKTLNSFINRWDKRIEISNKMNNESKERQVTLLDNMSLLVKQQLRNDEYVKAVQKNILGNLSSHRHVANFTYDLQNKTLVQQLSNEKMIIELENQTKDLQHQVKDIVTKLAEAQNITITPKQNESDQLLETLKGLLNKTQ